MTGWNFKIHTVRWVLASFLSLTLAEYAKAQTEIRIGVPTANPPWLYRDERSGELKGKEFKTQENLTAALGLTPLIIPYENITRLGAEIVNGHIDAGLVFYIDRRRSLYSDEISCTKTPYGVSDVYLYALENSTIKTTDDIRTLTHLKLATTLIINTHRYLSHFPKEQITMHKAPENVLKMIISGRADLCLAQPSTIEFLKKEKNITLKPVYKAFRVGVHMCFSNASLGKEKALHYARQYDKAIADAKAMAAPLRN